MPTKSLITSFPGLQPAWSPSGNLIVFVSQGDAPQNVNTLRIFNHVSNLFINLPVDWCLYPEWSQNEEWVIFSRIGKIWSIKPDGNGLHKWSLDQNISPNGKIKISPDGSMFAFKQSDGIHIIRANNSGAKCLYRSEWVDEPFWTPDSKRLLFGCPEGIVIADIENNITKIHSSAICTSPSMSPSGRWLVGYMDDKVHGSILAMIDLNQENANYLQIKQKKVSPHAVTWAPDESFFLFESDDHIYQYHIERKRSEIFCSDAFLWDSPPVFAPKENVVAITSKNKLIQTTINIYNYEK